MSVRWSYLGWYVGIKKSGKPKKGSKTWYPPHQKAIQFVAKKQSPFNSFPDTFNFGNQNSTRERRAAELDGKENSENTSPKTDDNANKDASDEANNSPILFIDDENGGIVDVAKTTTVNRVLHDLTK